MSQIMKSFMGLFVVLMMIVVVTGLLGVFLDVVEAQDFHTNAIVQLQDSDCSLVVMKQLYDAAAEKGYRLTIQFAMSEGLIESNSAAQLPAAVPDTATVIVRLEYPVRIIVFGMEKYRRLVGYAR